jgi:hypothetical protein
VVQPEGSEASSAPDAASPPGVELLTEGDWPFPFPVPILLPVEHAIGLASAATIENRRSLVNAMLG